MIHLPEHLQDRYPNPEFVPLIELACALAEEGYCLRNAGNGDIVTMPIEEVECE